ncbi:cytidylyltransferase domain-containing protein [Christiangramia echinicola]|uniref:N-acylneuraminate cytidylyltransferase n=1 Tax=Christiangramia echinicola TaxID=279359 RepID=A0A1H1L6D8_9FLAO|nr:acylneuraminate cytidylyltransferase family protein [Christiangramia echinicola]SDR69479.1 N-acylneuraminate cytidylyltransferase [Christiangramia echinicola]
MKILGIIPARGGSKGIPGKNIKILGKKPLIAYTYDSVKNSKLLYTTILSSEDPKIISVAKGIGLEVPFIRPEELAIDKTPTLDVILHAIEFYKKQNINFDAVCILQPTTPFRETGLIDTAIKKFQKGNYDSLITVRKVPEEFNPHWVFEQKNGSLQISTGEKNIIPRRQELPTAYFRDGAIYLSRTAILLKERSLYGENIGFIDNSDSPYVNLDSMQDWNKAEGILKQID